MAKPRMLLVAAVGATSSLLLGCPRVYGNPKAPPPDSSIDAPFDSAAPPPDAAGDAGPDAPAAVPDAHVTGSGS